MTANRENLPSEQPYEQDLDQRRGLVAGYTRFWLDPHEPIALKVAPIWMLGGGGVAVLTELIPIVGEVDDVGALALGAFLFFKTMRGINRHR